MHQTVLIIFGTGLHRKCPWCGPRNIGFNHEQVLPQLDTKESHFSPVGPPRVTDNPILFVVFKPPTDNAHSVAVMIRPVLGGIPQDAAREVPNRLRIHRRHDGTTYVNLGHNGGCVVSIDPILGHGRIRKALHGVACARRQARPENVERRASGIDMRTEAFCAIRGASNVGLAGINRDVSKVVNELIGSRGRSTMAAASNALALLDAPARSFA